jgi:ABC-type multidrug transport system ATPase subunit
VAQTLEKVYNYFPRLKTRRTSQAAYTSGGEQQMCAIGRALMANPTMVLLDEPSMGLAPQIVDEVFGIVKDLNQREKVTFLLAEQNTNMALRYADFGYILENGRVVMEGAASELANNEDVKEFYLGISSGERKSFDAGKRRPCAGLHGVSRRRRQHRAAAAGDADLRPTPTSARRASCASCSRRPPRPAGAAAPEEGAGQRRGLSARAARLAGRARHRRPTSAYATADWA